MRLVAEIGEVLEPGRRRGQYSHEPSLSYRAGPAVGRD
jgi:hypothetical protein